MIDTTNMLNEAVTQALETMAFMTILPPDEPQDIPETSFLAQMNFTGPKEGAIQILASQSFCRQLAENICGDESVMESAVPDALKELLNVTSGLLLPMLDSALTDVFEVSVPEAIPFDSAAQWREFVEEDGVTLLNAEGLALATRLIILT